MPTGWRSDWTKPKPRQVPLLAAAAAAETKHIVSGLKAYICFYHEADFERGTDAHVSPAAAESRWSTVKMTICFLLFSKMCV